MRESEKQKQFIESYDRFSDSIFRYCYLRVWSRELAQDLVQETFVRTWDYLQEGKQIDNFRPFLFRVATNLIIDESRKRKVVSLDLLKEKGIEPRLNVGRDFGEHFDANQVIDVIKSLDPKYREAVLLRFVEDLPVKEISRILGETEDNISVRIHRGLKKVKEILDHHGQII